MLLGDDTVVGATDEPASVPKARPWPSTADIVLAILATALIQLEIWVFGPDQPLDGPAWLASVFGAVAGMALTFRAFAPVYAFGANFLAVLLLIRLDYQSDFYPWTNLFLLFAVAGSSRLPTSLPVLGAALFGVISYFQAIPKEGGAAETLAVCLLWFAVWLGGRIASSRQRELMLRADRDLATALAATNQERLELEHQRAALAREVHDLVGHTVNVMVVHAGAARRAVHTDPDGAEKAMQTVETTGREALDELDRVLGMLRNDEDSPMSATPPGMASLTDLNLQFEQTGLTTSITVEGKHDHVPATIGLSVYRILQESLTNALKHANANLVEANVHIDDRAVRLTVEDDGQAGSSDIVPGRGLQGIRERVDLHGGSTDFGPRPEGGFMVSCELPLPIGRAQ